MPFFLGKVLQSIDAIIEFDNILNSNDDFASLFVSQWRLVTSQMGEAELRQLHLSAFESARDKSIKQTCSDWFRLAKQRNQVNAQLERFSEYVYNNPGLNTTELKIRFNKIEGIWEEFDITQSKIEALDTMQASKRNSFEDNYFAMIAAVHTLIEGTQRGSSSEKEQYESPEDLLNTRVRELSRVILHNISARADSIKVESRRASREAAEKVRDYAMEMVGIIRLLKHDVKQKDRKIAELRSKGDITVVAQVGQEEPEKTRGNRGYAEAVVRPKQATYAIKVTAREDKDMGQVQRLLKTSVDPVRAKVSVAAVRSIKSGVVIVKCNSKKDAEKLRTAVEASRRLRGKELEKANPRVILGRIDKDLR
ncbi:hypothetical protein ILUMI_24899 [Ignelater luminosus]|uniref:Uncharacterized protein n=1 Tax=Ignelater luminosus TaxID=2038154 RepID=A0A8K0FWF1_IGNLU|nr:hypothetical protein ILUMI_24899 [Ignelater luminosus]